MKKNRGIEKPTKILGTSVKWFVKTQLVVVEEGNA